MFTPPRVMTSVNNSVFDWLRKEAYRRELLLINQHTPNSKHVFAKLFLNDYFSYKI